MRQFVESVISGRNRGASGKPFAAVVNLGIGGSDSGPRLVAHALHGLGATRTQEAVAVALSALLDDQLDPRATYPVAKGLLASPEAREQALAFIWANLDVLLKRLPRDRAARLFGLGTYFCDDEHRAQIEAHLRSKVGEVVGSKRQLDQGLETLDQCREFWKRALPEVEAHLQGADAKAPSR